MEDVHYVYYVLYYILTLLYVYCYSSAQCLHFYEVWKGISQATSIFIQEAHDITHRIIKCFILDQETISNIL